MAPITIVGGGLAGMVAAWRLAERGCQVSLYEASDRLGGKAGANQHGDDFDEHGYHIFPAWYLNIWQLVDELKIRQHFIDCTDFEQLRPGETRYTTLRNITSPKYAWQNFTSGVMPFEDMVLFFYATVDLLSQPYSYRAFLDQVSISGFLRSRFYRTDRVARQFQELMLKGISVPTYFVSAMTMQNVIKYWARYPEPMYRILAGNLQTLFIDPLERRLRDLGCQIYTGQRLIRIDTEASRIARLEFEDVPTQTRHSLAVDRVILALPAEKMAGLVTDEVYQAAPRLGQIRHIRTQAMAAYNIYFETRVPDIPADHINLVDSRFGLSFIDVSQRWPGYTTTVLNVIASDYTELEGVTDQVAQEEILKELKRFLPQLHGLAIRRVDFQNHLDAPLFMNDVGIWRYRPEGLPAPNDEAHRPELSNLHLAGDYCRSHVDLVCMEGAVTTGLKAAEAVRRAEGIRIPVPVLVPSSYPTFLWWLLKIVLLPFAIVAKVVASIRARFDPTSVIDIKQMEKQKSIA